MADVPTFLVGENGIAGRKIVITGRRKPLLGEKCIVLTITQFIQKINKKKSPTKASQTHHGGGGLRGWDNVPTLPVFL